MITLNIKPLSVNDAYDPIAVKLKVKGGRVKWIGQMVKSKKYQSYTKQLPLLLPKELQLPPGKLVFLVRYYFATAASDLDNPQKPMQDLIADYYGLNDNQIYLLLTEKNTGYKGKEHIKFEFLQYKESMFDVCREAIISTDE